MKFARHMQNGMPIKRQAQKFPYGGRSFSEIGSSNIFVTDYDIRSTTRIRPS